MQLTGPEILRCMRLPNTENADNKPDIIIRPFNEKFLGSNSYDLHLSNTLKVYKHTLPKGMKPAIKYSPLRKDYSMRDWFRKIQDYNNYCKNPNAYNICDPKYLMDPCSDKPKEMINVEIPESGLILSPRIGYLGSTVEYTETYNLCPHFDGKSSVGRNFMLVHHTAGRGDDGFCGTWTLEIRVLYPTVVYPNMRIGQIYYEELKGTRKPYNENLSSHYNGQKGPKPAAPIPIEKTR